MKKSEFVSRLLQKNPEFTIEIMSDLVNDMFSVLREDLVRGGSYSHDNFGTLKVVKRAPRKGRHPVSGKEIDIPGKYSVKFVPSQKLEDDLNK